MNRSRRLPSALHPTDARYRIALVQAAAGLSTEPLPSPAAQLAGEEELAGALGWRVRRRELTASPAQADRWERTYRATAARNLFASAKVAELTGSLAERGVPAVVLKGMALLATTYPSPGARTMKDVDLLVPESGWATARALLAEIGARPMWHHPDRPVTQARFREAAYWLDWGMGLDLHRKMSAIFPVDHDGVFARSRSAGGLVVPAPEDTFVHLAIHAASDAYLLPLRSVVDGLLLLASGTLSPERVAERAGQWSARRVTARWLDLLAAFDVDARPDWRALARDLDPGGGSVRWYRPPRELHSGRRHSLYVKTHFLTGPDRRGVILPYIAWWTATYLGDVVVTLGSRLAARIGITLGPAPPTAAPTYSGTSRRSSRWTAASS